MISYQVMPALSEQDYLALKKDIDAVGVLIPIEYDEDGNILDGHHRVKICDDLGITVWPKLVRKGLSEEDKFAHARRLNIARRHINQAQRQELIADQLKATPEKSNRDIAGLLGVDHKTVGGVRDGLESGGEIPHHDTRVGKDGVSQPAKKPIRKHIPTLHIPHKLDEVKSKPFVEHNTGNNEWYTPPDLLDAARLVLGGIDLDPASSGLANEAVKASLFYTAENDGLQQDWPQGKIWLNPPYAQPLMGQFATKYAEAIQAGSTGIVLVNSATETGWFQELSLVSSAICFYKSRVKFLDQNGDPGAPLQGQAIMYAGRRPNKFKQIFDKFGIVLEHLK